MKMRKTIMPAALWSVCVLLTVLLAVSCTQNQRDKELDRAGMEAESAEEIGLETNKSAQTPEQDVDSDTDGNDHANPKEEAIAEKPKARYVDATLTAVGDIMLHSPQVTAGYDSESGTFDFNPFFTEIKSLLSEGDWVVGNLETPLAGKEAGYLGYPRFNAPDEYADALKNAGFNILTTANNHAMDQWETGLLRTLEALKERELVPVGTHASAEEAGQIAVVEKKGVSMAFLAYTYGTNGIPVPENKPYLVNLIDVEKIRADIESARRTGVDLVTVCLHMAGEYHRQPNEYQIRLVEQVVNAGADIILGGHPHVVQPYQFFQRKHAESGNDRGVVIYSLGNFISNQGPAQGTAKYTDVGVIFNISIRKHFPSGNVEITGVQPITTWVHKYVENRKRKYRILPVSQTLEQQKDPLLTERDYPVLQTYLQEMNEHLASMAVPVDQAPDPSSPSGSGPQTLPNK